MSNKEQLTQNNERLNQIKQTIANLPEYVDTSDANATADDIKQGKTAYVNGEKVEGNLVVVEGANAVVQIRSSNLPNAADFWKENLIELPELDLVGKSSLYQMFMACNNLRKIHGLINTSQVTNTNDMFYSCNNLIEIPLFDMSNSVTAKNMFYACNNIQTIPSLNTGKVKNAEYMFQSNVNDNKLKTISTLNFESVKELTNLFGGRYGIENVGGFLQLGKSYDIQTTADYRQNLNFQMQQNLTHDSLMNIINNLYDLNLNENLAVDGVCQYPQNLILHNRAKARLTDEEKAIATAKGWTIA